MSAPNGSVTPRAARVGIAALSPAEQGSYWVIPVLRAVPALALGLVITFTADHSARVGLISFGAFALVTGLIVAVGSARILSDRVLRGVFVGHGVIAAISGTAALVLWSAGIGVLLLIITLFTALTGALELYASLRAKGVAPARDWFTVGAYTAVAAIVFVLISPDSILVTGLIGAYGIILGVFLTIAGLSLKWANRSDVTDETNDAAAELSAEGETTS